MNCQAQSSGSSLNSRILLRPTEYKILFDSLARNAEDAELEAEARMYEQCREMVNTIAQAADNMMDAQYIENFDGDITGYLSSRDCHMIESESEYLILGKGLWCTLTRSTSRRHQIMSRPDSSFSTDAWLCAKTCHLGRN